MLDRQGNVWWYDGWGGTGEDQKPYYVVDAVSSGLTNPCGDVGMIMRGIEVDNSIAIYASPDYIHTKWNISHRDTPLGNAMFDYCAYGYDSSNPMTCGIANPCGKADELEGMWRNDVANQLRSQPHLVMTVCQKGKGWADSTMKVPTFDTDVGQLVAAELFEPIFATNNIHSHIEWDKAPKGSVWGDGEGWQPFKFSQCCSTIVIAPQI